VIRSLLLVALLAAGCSASAGGWKFCLLDHADLTLRVAHPHTDPNGPHNHP